MSIASPKPTTVSATPPEPTTADAAELLVALGTTSDGLAAADARDRLEASGPNRLARLRRTPMVVRYLEQFRDWMILLLLASAAVTAYLGDVSTAVVLVVLVLLNTTIGFVQEFRAEQTMQQLQNLVEPTAEAYRNGRLSAVPSGDLVVGDVIRLVEGATVPADVRILTASALTVNEFALTGESRPSRKSPDALPEKPPIAERRNCAYAGTSIASGEGTAVVVATGSRTELGRIADLSQEARHSPSPLQREMSTIAAYVSVAVCVLATILLVIAVAADLPFREALLFAVGFACALVPQGLPAEVSTALAQASGILARQRALVKKLSSVETLGATHVICTDKTGTLTKNQMTVTRCEVGGAAYTVQGTGYEPVGAIVPVERAVSAIELRRFLEIGVLSSNAQLLPPDTENPDWHIFGDPTEGALLVLAAKGGVDLAELAERPELRELPFDSVRKRMSSLRPGEGGGVTVAVKGAPETVVAVASRIMDGGEARAITDDDRAAFLERHRGLAGHALRNLAFAVREFSAEEVAAAGGVDALDPGDVESDLTLIGMVSMIDPLRDEVPDAISATRLAHVQVNIVTGDSALTAQAIAAQAGLDADQQLLSVDGAELAAMSDERVLELATRGSTVFSRVAPEDKMRIVDLVQRSGLVVAVTGDGINDAPALKRADIGVAMGATGTDVAKEAADVVLLDDSFATLVRAIREGRTIYANIHKGVLSCLTSNIAEFFVNSASLALAVISGFPLALNVLQILAIDVLGEILPIAALGSDPEEGEHMRERPRDPRARILNGRTITDVLWTGFAMGAAGMGAFLGYFALHGIDPAGTLPDATSQQATSVTYATVLLAQLTCIMQRRSVHGLFTRYQFTNLRFWFAQLTAAVILLVILYVPAVSGFFGTAPLGVGEWLLVACGVAVVIVLREGVRLAGWRVRADRPPRS